MKKNLTLLLTLCSVIAGGLLVYWSTQPKKLSLPSESPSSVSAESKPVEAHAPTTFPNANKKEEPAFDLSKIQTPPTDTEENYVEWMKKNRGEEEKYLRLRYQRWQSLISNSDIYRDKETKAFLLAPREKFCREKNLSRVYDHAFLDIGYGVTISGPFLVGRMTSSIDVQPGEKVLEVGTGSGYQSSVLSYLTDHVYTIEIIEALQAETDKIYSSLSKKDYPEYRNVHRKSDDGYYGWSENGPFDKIIVTCGIDHIPPELLKQLKVGGIMVIPVGPPGAQVILKVNKSLNEQGEIVVTREDLYGGHKKVPFVPFTKKGGGTWNQ